MKKLFIVIILFSNFIFFYNNILSMSSDTVYVSKDSLLHSIRLPEIWRYLEEDDSIKAFQSDPFSWDTLNVIDNLADLKEGRWKGIGWFYKKIIIDSTLINKSISMRIEHFGASEIYVNNKLLKKFGKVGDLNEEEIYQPRNLPLIFNFDSTKVYDIRIRYSNQRAAHNRDSYIQWVENWGFRVYLSDVQDDIFSLLKVAVVSNGMLGTIGGLFLSLAVLYFLVFLFYQKKKENLFYSLFAFSLSLLLFRVIVDNIIRDSYTIFVILNAISALAILFIFLFFISFLYSIFYERLPKFFYAALLITLGLALFMVFTNFEKISEIALVVYILLFTLEGLRIIILAIKRKKTGAYIIGSGVIVFVLFVLFIFIVAIMGKNISGIYALVLVFIGLFAVPISMSIYLAHNIAKTNKDLSKQLETVKELSQKELENQRRTAELELQTEKEKAASQEAQLRAETAELQAKAAEAQARAIQAENERKTKELEEARQLQLSMLPKTLPASAHFEIAAYMKTATEVGGDYYDFYYDSNETLTTVIGDATGHGLNAGTIVTITKSLFNTYAKSADILYIFQEISKAIKEMNFKLLSMCLMILKIKNNKLQISAAGMPPALIFRDESKKVEELLIRGMPLGAPASFPYEIISTDLKKGDTILLMSDGFPELFNSNREMFGYKRVKSVFEKCAPRTPNEIIEYLKNNAEEWMRGNDPDDDITFVIIKMT